MFSKKPVLALFAAVVVLSMLAAACGAPAAPQTIVETVVVEKEGETVIETVVVEKEVVKEVEKVVEVGALPPAETLVRAEGYQDVPTLDPSLAEDSSAINMTTQMFIGPVDLDEETGDPMLGMANDWTVSEDGLVYTFNLRDDVPWVRFNNVTGEVEQVLDDEGNVRIVNCNEFLYGIRRTLDPNTGGNYAYVNWFIENAGAVNGENGEDDPLFGQVDQIGVECLDDFTLQYTLREPAAFFPSIASMWINWAEPQWLIEEKGDRWVEPGVIETYGPYTLFDWTHDASITLIANPFWPGSENRPQPSIKYIHNFFLDEPEQLANYEAGLMDEVPDVPDAELDRIRADATLSAELAIFPDTCTYYYGFNVTKPPFDDVNVRKAFSWAVDRQALIDNVTKGGQEPARWFARPGLTAAPTPADYDFGPPASADVEAAQEFLAASSYGSAENLPEITLMYNESTAHARIAETFQQMWKENLGVEVNLVSQEWAVFLDTLEQDSPQIWRLGWCMDYPDASNFDKDVFRSDAGNNHTRWGNDRFDELVDQAVRETDVQTRTELYAEAEQILVDEDAAMIPIYWYTGVRLTKPYVTRTFGLGGQENFAKWTMDKPE